MKEIKEERFTKKRPEDIGFAATVIPDEPSVDATIVEPSDDHSAEVHMAVSEIDPVEKMPIIEAEYLIRIPLERTYIRQTFEIYEDQLASLKKIQMAEREQKGNKEGLTQGDLAREAFDRFIAELVKKLDNTRLIKD